MFIKAYYLSFTNACPSFILHGKIARGVVVYPNIITTTNWFNFGMITKQSGDHIKH
jgi:hypothetical protein